MNIAIERWIGRVAVATLAASAAGAAAAQQAQPAQQVKIGFAAPLTGEQAHYGEDFRNGVQLAIDDFNATRPSIGGVPVQAVLEVADDRADPGASTIAAHRFVDDGVVAVLGHFNSDASIRAAPVYAHAGIPELAMATASAYTQQGLRTTFRLMTSDAQLGRVLGRYAVKGLAFRRFAIVDDRTSYGQGVADEFAKAVKAAGGAVVVQTHTNDKATDFRAVLAQIGTSGADAIFYGGADTQAAALLKQMRRLSVHATLIGPDMVHSDTLLARAGDSAEGTLAASGGSPVDRMPGGAQYMQRYTQRFGKPVGLYSPYAYDGAMAVLTAMKVAGSTNPHRYLGALRATQMRGVTTTDLAYDERGDLKYGGVTVYKVEHGKWVALQTVGTK